MIILGTNSIKDTGYDVANSLRFNDGDSPSMSKSISSTGNAQFSIFSCWVKRGVLGTNQTILNYHINASNTTQFGFNSDDKLIFHVKDGGSDIVSLISNAVFRDTSAFYHVMLVQQQNATSASDRIKIMANGSRLTLATSTIPGNLSSNHWVAGGDGSWSPRIGFNDGADNNYFDGYLTEVVFLDGHTIPNSNDADYTANANSTVEYDEDSGILKPKNPTGLSFGTNGYYLDFKDSSALGNDAAGSNNFSVTNLAATDQTTDTCTNNFATMNPLDNFYASSTFSEGNTNIVTDASSKATNTSTFGINSGKWYCEIKAVQIYNGNAQFGIKGKVSTSTSDGVGEGTDGYCYTASNGNKINNGSASSFGTTWNNNDIIGIAVDLDNNKLYFSRNGTWQSSGDPTSGATGTGSAFNIGTPSSGFYFIATSDNDTSDGSANNYLFNFGSPEFAISSGNTDGSGFGNFEYAVPSGYFALCTKNLAENG